MADLSRNVIGLIDRMDGIDEEIILRDQLRGFDIDVVLEDGQTVPVQGGLSVRVMSTPGHTRDMLSYYIPEKKILFATEAASCLGKAGRIVTEYSR